MKDKRTHDEPKQCPICHNWYKFSYINCMVVHQPGECCHYLQERVGPPKEAKK